MGTCTGNVRQKWIAPTGGRITPQGTKNLCLNVGQIRQGAFVQVMSCTTPLQSSMKWAYTAAEYVPGTGMTHGNGQIHSTVDPALCIETMGPNTVHARLMLKRCSPASKSQQFLLRPPGGSCQRGSAGDEYCDNSRDSMGTEKPCSFPCTGHEHCQGGLCVCPPGRYGKGCALACQKRTALPGKTQHGDDSWCAVAKQKPFV